MRCPSCGFENPTTAKFCQECGGQLAVGDRPAAVSPPGLARERAGSALVQGERRQLTLMFSDLVGSTELSARLDPEEWHAVVVQYHRMAAEAISRFGGHVGQYQGDGIIVFFGYPQAHEDDAERAVRAGLALLSDLDVLNRRLVDENGLRLSIRVGVHTGLIMVGTGVDDTPWVFGETPNLAARVQTAAEPNTMYITAATYRLVAGFFLVEDRGPQQLKGVPEAVQLYRVLRPSGVRGRLHATPPGRLVPFVGRDRERRVLMECWERARNGAGQVLLIRGEAGIGKSRLLQQFKQDLGVIPHTWVEGGGSPYQQHTPFAPIIDLLQQAFRAPADPPADQDVSELDYAFTAVGIDASEAVPLVAPLVGLAVPERYPPLLISPEQRRRKLIATLVDWVFSVARLQPLVLAVEDMHWTDPSTLEVFGLLTERAATAPMLFLLTARPEFQAPWPPQAHHSQMILERLNPQHVHDMIVGLVAKLVPSDEMVEKLAARADGVPLYVEELTRTVVESGLGAAGWQQIPATLRDLLMARLDRLGPAKEVAQVGAVLGREFSYPLLRAVVGFSDVELLAALARLADADLIYLQGAPPEAVYLFKHVLIQDAAYTSLLKSQRRELHHSVAQVLDQQFPELVAARPELVAHHYTEAGEAEAAVKAWQRAGELARGRSALVEATQHYTQALEVLNTLPDTPERAQQELLLQLSLGQMLGGAKGFGSPEVARAFGRARQIAEQLGGTPQFFFALFGLRSEASSRAEQRAAQELDDQLLRLAERDGAPPLLVYAHTAQGLTHYMRGDVVGAREHMDCALSFYREDDHRGYPFNPKISASMHGTWALWHLGLLDQARQRDQEQLDLAEQLSPINLGLARGTSCCLSFFLREPDRLLDHAERLVEFGKEQQLPVFLAWGTMYRGWALAEQGRHDEGLELILQGLAGYLASGMRTGHRIWLAMLATVYLQAGAIDEGVAAIDDSLGTTIEEEIYIPELLRLRGDLLWKKAEREQLARGREQFDGLQAAESNYGEALSIARRQGSKMGELRAALGLGRLLKSMDRAAEARALLAPPYATFSEGFDTRDLREAQALLDDL